MSVINWATGMVKGLWTVVVGMLLPVFTMQDLIK